MNSSLMTLENMKKEGIKHEQELVKMFEENDFAAFRLPASGKKSPDIIAGDENVIFIIEAKTTTNTLIKIRKQQIFNLRNTATKFRAKPVLAVKFIDRESWRFIKIGDLKSHEKSFSIDYNSAMLKGIDFRELISNELQKKLV